MNIIKHYLLKNSFLRGVLCLMLCVAGIENVRGEEVTVTFDATKQEYSNGQVITNVTITNGITIAFTKGTASPAYYTSGTAIRCYAKGGITITSTIGIITKVTFTYGSNDGSNAITANVGKFNANTWNGAAETITFSIEGTSGNRRIKTITITYEKETNTPAVSSLKISGTPTNTTYYIGDTPSPEGLYVTAYYTDGSSTDITSNVEWSFNPRTISKETTQITATAKYREITSDYTFDIATKETIIYNLTPIEGGSQTYYDAGTTEILINGVKWFVTGNSKILPWRIGGNTLENDNRDIKNSTPIYGTFGKVVVSIGETSGSITLHSLTLSVADNPNFDNETKYKHTSNLKANTEHTFNITPTTDGYYKITFNVSVSGSNNKYYEFSGAKFYKTHTTTLSSAGYATFCLPYNAIVPEGMTAYTATDNGESVKLTAKESNKIAAGEGVILKGEEGTYTFVAAEGNVNATESNQLVGVTKDTQLSASDNAYMLTRDKDTNAIAFRRLATTTPYTLSANKAYLKLNEGDESRQLISVTWNDNATSIYELKGKKDAHDGAIYNLAGQKLIHTQKGINIINGKLVIK